MLLLKLIYWKLVDLYRSIVSVIKKEEKKVHLFGIYGFFGLPGKGKTIALVDKLNSYKEKYCDKILITTNFNYKYQDFEFESWEQLLDKYDKPLIVAWDEVQNEFNSRNFKTFPISLLTLLTQNRKGNGIQILYTAQRFERVDKVFRELTHYCITCNTILKRLTRTRYYHYEDYTQLINTNNVDQKIRIRPIMVRSFVQDDKIRECYDSYKMLESAKTKEYLDREEMQKININENN